LEQDPEGMIMFLVLMLVICRGLVVLMFLAWEIFGVVGLFILDRWSPFVSLSLRWVEHHHSQRMWSSKHKTSPIKGKQIDAFKNQSWSPSRFPPDHWQRSIQRGHCGHEGRQHGPFL
jgi:hypothetical protein